MSSDPTENPTVWEHPTLDGIPIPGTRVVCTGGGDRELKIEQAQQVGYAGAFTAVRGEEMAVIAYRIEAVDKATRDAVKAFLEVLRIGQKRKAAGGVNGSFFKPVAYAFIDPAVEHNGINNVITHKIGRWYRPNEKSNLWAVDVSFKEWKKPIRIGGTVGAKPKTELERQIEDIEAQNKVLKGQLDALNKAKK